jgi:hypothetical protein
MFNTLKAMKKMLFRTKRAGKNSAVVQELCVSVRKHAILSRDRGVRGISPQAYIYVQGYNSDCSDEIAMRLGEIGNLRLEAK